MYQLTPHITIGIYSFESVNDVVIKKSIHSYEDTATIKIPTSGRLQSALLPTISTPTNKIFNEGDPVTIKLGYDGQLQTEFTGFVKRINFTTPLEIECEGYVWQLRRTKKYTANWKKTTLKEVLNMIIAGTDVKLSPDIKDTTLEPFRFEEKTAAEVLELLKTKALQTIYFVDGNTLYAGLENLGQIGKTVKYKLGWNTIKDGDLKFRRPEDIKVEVNVTYKNKSGKEQHSIKTFGKGRDAVKVPDTLRLDSYVDATKLEAMAKKYAEKYRHAGYEGKITTFLQPYAQPGWEAQVTDEQYPERDGNFIIESTEVRFGQQGGRRIVDIGATVNV